MNRKTKKKSILTSAVLILLFLASFFLTKYLLFKWNESKETMAIQSNKQKYNPYSNLKDYEYAAPEVMKLLSNKNYCMKKNGLTIPKEKKIAFLTFDDGPSVTVTPKVLKTLKEKKVKGTFFLVGKSINSDSYSKKLVKQIYNDGNSIGNHSYTHNLSIIYPHNKISMENLMKEINLTNTSLKKILEKNFATRIIRLPGGYMSRSYYNDPNIPALNQTFNKNKFYSIDWNSMSGDAEGGHKSSDELLNYLKNSIKGKNKVVILTHDTYGKESSAKALPFIIDYLKSQGYEFGTIK